MFQNWHLEYDFSLSCRMRTSQSTSISRTSVIHRSIVVSAINLTIVSKISSQSVSGRSKSRRSFSKTKATLADIVKQARDLELVNQKKPRANQLLPRHSQIIKFAQVQINIVLFYVVLNLNQLSLYVFSLSNHPQIKVSLCLVIVVEPRDTHFTNVIT